MTDQTSTPATPRMSIAAGIGTVVAIFALSSLWIGLGGKFFHLHSFFASFVFAWYWGAVERMAFNRWLPSVIGALAGIALSWQLTYLSAHFGTPGLACAVLLIAVAVLCLVMQWLSAVLNMSAMLFMALLAAPQFAGADYLDMAATVAAGAMFMAAVIYAIQRITTARGQPQT